MTKIVQVPTTAQIQMIDVSALVEAEVHSSGVQDGLCTVFVPHTTAAVTINENADPDVPADMVKALNKVIPFNDNYAHMEGNSAAHIKATLTGSSETIIIENGRLKLGTWQGIFFCEYDGPRNRKLWVKIIGASNL